MVNKKRWRVAISLAIVVIFVISSASFLAFAYPFHEISTKGYPHADRNFFDWNYGTVKWLDPAGDSPYPYADMIAFYYSEDPNTLVFRIDLLDWQYGDDSKVNFYIFIDYKAGGTYNSVDNLPVSPHVGDGWDLAIAIYGDSHAKIYLPNGKTDNSLIKAGPYLDAFYDAMEMEIYKPPGFVSGSTLRFIVYSVEPGSNKILDRMPDSGYFDSNHRVGTAKLMIIQHANQHIAWTNYVYGGYGTGYDEVIRLHQWLNEKMGVYVPLNLHISGTLLVALEWYYPGFLDWIKQGVKEGWIDLLTSAFGQQIMPFFPTKLNVESIQIEDSLIQHIFGVTPQAAWIPERVWETKSSDPSAILEDPWVYLEQAGIKLIILDGNTCGSKAPNIHKVYYVPGTDIKVIFIDNWLQDNMFAPGSPTIQAKEQLLSLAMSSDQQQVLVYADDLEKAAGVGGWTTSFQSYADYVKWAAAHPWIQFMSIHDLLTWDNGNWGVAGQYMPLSGTYKKIGGLQGYGGSGPPYGRDAWYKD